MEDSPCCTCTFRPLAGANGKRPRPSSPKSQLPKVTRRNGRCSLTADRALSSEEVASLSVFMDEQERED